MPELSNRPVRRQLIKMLGQLPLVADFMRRLQIERVALRKLQALDAAESLDDLREPPSNRLECLERDRSGQWSIRVNDQYRVCFRWEHGADDVEIVDYH